jgi:hypothetical protein
LGKGRGGTIVSFLKNPLSLKEKALSLVRRKREENHMKNQEIQVEFEEPPGHERPSHPCEDASFLKWNDWRWQLTHHRNTMMETAQVVYLTPQSETVLSTSGLFYMDVTPHFASLMTFDDPNCPIWQQAIPIVRKLVASEVKMAKDLAEEVHSPVPDQMPMLVTTHRHPAIIERRANWENGRVRAFQTSFCTLGPLPVRGE